MKVTKENAESFFLRMALSFSDCKDGKSIQTKVDEMRKPLSKEEYEILDDYFDKNRRKCWRILSGGICLSLKFRRLFSNCQTEEELCEAIDKAKDFSEIMQAIEESRADFISQQERFLEYAISSEIKRIEDLDGFYGLVKDYSMITRN